MASIWRHPKSPYWTACFTDETGKQRKKTTKETDARKARKAADAYEEAARKAKAGELTRTTATKIVNELMERVHGEGMDLRSTKDYFADYLTRLQAKGVRSSTVNRYKPIFDGFVAHLGEIRAKARLASVTAFELESFRDAELTLGKGASTADFSLKVLNGVFEDARRKAVILHNPVQAVSRLSTAVSEEREPFSDAQVKKLLSVANLEWQGMILFAYHTGMRLTDISSLTWANIEEGILSFRDKKTSHRKQRVRDRETRMIMPEDLKAYLAGLTPATIPTTPIFPTLCKQKAGSNGGLSNSFAHLMEKAKIDAKPRNEKKGKGRVFNALSFHSFRHTMISRLANSDAPAAIRKKLTGHSTDEAHERYIHLDLEAQAKIMGKAPRLWKH